MKAFPLNNLTKRSALAQLNRSGGGRGDVTGVEEDAATGHVTGATPLQEIEDLDPYSTYRTYTLELHHP